MKITAVELHILEDPSQPQGTFKLREVPNLRRVQYTHGSKSIPTDRKQRQHFLKVKTDEGIAGGCTTTMTPDQVDIMRNQVLGEEPLHRERLFQMLHKGTRRCY